MHYYNLCTHCSELDEVAQTVAYLHDGSVLGINETQDMSVWTNETGKNKVALHCKYSLSHKIQAQFSFVVDIITWWWNLQNISTYNGFMINKVAFPTNSTKPLHKPMLTSHQLISVSPESNFTGVPKLLPFCIMSLKIILSKLLLQLPGLNELTHWSRHKMAAISQTTLSSAFSWMKMYKFWLRFHWSLFLWAQLIIFQHCFR